MKGQHRKPGGSAAPWIVLAVVVLVLLGAVGWFAFGRSDHARPTARTCTATDLQVTAAPAIEPAVAAEATAWNAKKTTVDGSCVRIVVASGAPSDTAAAVAGTKGVTVNGLGKPDGSAKIPDVWVPDSSTWLTRLATAAPDLALTGTSIATSPIVIAVPQPVALQLASTLKSLTWQSVLAELSGGTVHPGIVDPNVDAASLNTLLTVGAVATGGSATPSAAAQGEIVGAMRALATGSTELPAELMSQFPRATDATTLARSMSAAPVSEQALLAYNAVQPPVPLVGLYITPAPEPLDYPYTPMLGLSKVKADAAAAFGKLLTGTAWRDQLAGADLRAADGTFGAAMPTTLGMPAGPLTVTAAGATAISATLSTWSAVTVPGRMLAVIDISGSMAAKVPTAGNATREQVTVGAAKAGLGLFDDRWTVGLWVFSTDLDGTKPYKQLVPIESLATNRSSAAAALGLVKPIPTGDTGLYDTVLAAYKDVQAGWDPSRVNSVVIMTDGENDNPGGLTQPQFLADIAKVKDPAKPIEVIAIGIGNEVNKDELQKITTATGGGVFLASDPAMISQIFLQAIALRPGTSK